MGTYLMNKTGVLSEDWKAALIQNVQELTAIEGNLLSAAGGKEIKTLFLTSCHPGEGTTTSAVSMAYALATKTRGTVLLVDGNYHAPKIHKIFGIPVSPGLSDMLVSNFDLNSLVMKTEYPSLSLMSSGSEVPNVYDKMKAKEFGNVLEKMGAMFDHVLFDGPPVFGASDVSLIARHFDSVVLVIEAAQTRWEVVQQASEKIDKAGGKILGVVLNKRRYYIPKALYGKI